MGNVIIAFIVVSALAVWLAGWWGVAAIALFLLGAYGYSLSPRKVGRVGRFVERLGVDKK